MRLLFSYGFLLVVLGIQVVAAQPVPMKGMVWEVPEDPVRAAEDLRQMRRIGVEAVRTGLIQDPRLLTLADTLGLQLFQELPMEALPARRLLDTLGYAMQLLEPVLRRAQGHPSARHFGLARGSDTSDPAARAFFEQLVARARVLAPEGSRFYYQTPFARHDRCVQAVDFVLLDLLDSRRPLQKLARWRAGWEGQELPPFGVGAIGTWVRTDGAVGVRVAHSAEAQARYLETYLRELLGGTGAASPFVVFVHRWRDVEGPFPSPAHDLRNAYLRTYGLLTAEGAQRPALDVVSGIYSGRQMVFAFPPGPEPSPGFAWAVLLGWIVLVVLGAFYALSPRFRQTVPRYFKAHGFYREAVREGRDILFATSTVLLVVLALSVGIVASVILRTVRGEEAFVLFTRWLPQAAQEALVALLAQPLLLALLVSSAYAFGLILWSAVLSLSSRRRYLLVPGQAVMLIVWPRWVFLVLMVAAMVISTLPYEHALPAALILAGCWAVAGLYATARTLFDYAAITRVPPYMTAAVALANPFTLLLIIGLFVALEYRLELAFLWHMLLRA